MKCTMNLVCYEGSPLGWAKVLDNRANNYFPKGWKILKAKQE